ncbi:dTDP-4-dehydrorhamnose reductase [Telmatocola sphagniphila]|uniref:dTDP-4-dehydrorhamnose reductase n=1 Tax=Telmatocola sphagniphila TaxID=1123043 RepID=A0A8E6EVU0_9BACT|nr:dTDP-4-dehydrorhamnose reductase [Telmatocola sphagniphila]QVL33052.1 dTDP-4-dehydrorhamnose reductase [Telmatocola sphagniphila]
MRYAIIGSAGQLGTALQKLLGNQAIPLTRADFDAIDAASLRRKLTELQPTHLINCSAYNFVDKAEQEPEVAFRSNAWAVRDMATICSELSAKFVHVSTDYVFGLDTTRTIPFRETDAPGPVSVYGVSKLTGEYFAQTYSANHLVIRTCGLYGVRQVQSGKGTNFVDTMRNLARAGKALKVINDQHCTPSFVEHVAQALVEMLHNDLKGLYHVTNSGQTNWYEFAKTIFELSGIQANLSPTTAAEYANQFPIEKRPARRPGYSVLSCDKLLAGNVKQLPDWRAGLADYLKSV